MTSPITVYDNLLQPHEQAAVWQFLNLPGWSFGGYSQEGGDRYLYKHYAGFFASGQEARDAQAVEDELAQNAPLLAQLWALLKAQPLQGQTLARCYANAMAGGVEGGVHLDSDVPTHKTCIYYAHPEWNANLGGETVLFNEAGDEIIGAIYPRPNRLAIFSGTIPHVARPMSRRSSALRITLMFKTMPA